VLKAEVGELAPTVRRLLRLDEPGKLQEALEKLNA
jgi:phosphotransferase system enzyme I (PtsI)